MSLLQNFNKKSLTIAATVFAVLVGGVGVSFALSALPDSTNDSPTPTMIAGVPTQDLTDAADSTVAVVVPDSTSTDSTATGSASTSTSSMNTSAMTTSVGAPPAASIGSGVGGYDDDDDDDDHEEDDDDDDD